MNSRRRSLRALAAATLAASFALIASARPAEGPKDSKSLAKPTPAASSDEDDKAQKAPLNRGQLEARKRAAEEASRPDRRSRNSRSLPPRMPDDLGEFVRDRQAAIALGKALFWDVRVGSDGVTACATCHHHAGADARTRNTFYSFDPADARPSRGDGQVAGSRGHFAVAGKDRPEVIAAEHQTKETKNRGRVFGKDRRWSVGSEGIRLGRFAGLNADGTERRVDLTEAELDATERHRLGLFGYAHRQVTSRNGPTVIGSALNDRQFLDGRASDVFNGYNPFGTRGDDTLNTLGRYRVVGGRAVLLPYLRIGNASLASQAVGPALNEFEMSYSGRTFLDLADKLLDRRPLEAQAVSDDDSALAGYVDRGGKGLRLTYRDLIARAFQPDWWDSAEAVDVRTQDGLGIGDADGSSGGSYRLVRDVPVIKANFSLFFGLAIMLYEGTLISDDAPFDRFLRGDRAAIVSRDPRDPTEPRNQWRGFERFRSLGCIDCHLAPSFSGGSSEEVRGVLGEGEADPAETPGVVPDPLGLEVVEWMKLDPFEKSRLTRRPYDNGFYNLGLVKKYPPEHLIPGQPNPGYDDYGVADGVRLEVAGSVQHQLPNTQRKSKTSGRTRPEAPDDRKRGPASLPTDKPGSSRYQAPDPVREKVPNAPAVAAEMPADPLGLEFSFSQAKRRFNRLAVVDGAFRAPTLRNIELTGPYMHNGSYLTLDGVLEFYDRGGDFGENDNPHLHPAMREFRANHNTPEGISDDDQADILAFLRSLTDERVRLEQAPFDHPELPFPSPEDPLVPAVGRSGRLPKN